MEDAVITPGWRRGIPGGRPPKSYNSASNALRREGGSYAAIRLARNFAGVPAPVQGLDIVIVREISEDVYIAHEYTSGDDTAMALKIITRQASAKVVRFAFEFAVYHGRRKITAVHKANVLKQTDGLFVKVAREVAEEYPQIEFEDTFIDASCVYVVARLACLMWRLCRINTGISCPTCAHRRREAWDLGPVQPMGRRRLYLNLFTARHRILPVKVLPIRFRKYSAGS